MWMYSHCHFKYCVTCIVILLLSWINSVKHLWCGCLSNILLRLSVSLLYFLDTMVNFSTCFHIIACKQLIIPSVFYCRATDRAVEPLKSELAELEQLIKDQQDKICAVKSNILKNEEKIQKMVTGVNFSSRAWSEQHDLQRKTENALKI